MKSFITVLIFIVLGFSQVFAACGTNCTNALKDSNLFTAGSGYGSWGLAYYRDSAQAPIQTAHSAQITKAIIIIHGNTRDAQDYFCYTSYAVESVGEKDNTYIVAPHFMMLSDNPQANAFYWVNNAGWKEGGRSHQDTTRISSFAMMDDLVKAFYNKDWFPGVKDVLIVGHSAGGQTVQRYAVATGIDASYNVRYVVANPGTYTYLNTFRAILPNITTPTCTACVGDDILNAKYQFAIVPRATQQSCPVYNNWKMGIDDGNVYLNQRNASEIRTQYGKKNVWYVLSTSDTCNNDLGSCGCNDNSLDTGCDALLLGYCRLMRGVAYYQYLQFYYKGTTANPIHQLSYIDGLGHDGCLVINSNVTLKAMFNKLPIPSTTTGESIPSSTTGESTPSSTTGSGTVTQPPASENTPSPTSAPTNAPTSAPTSAPSNDPTVAPKVVTEVKALLTMSGNAADCDPAPIRASIANDLKVDVNAVTVTVTTTATRAVSATFYLDVRVKYTNVEAADTASLQSQVTTTVQSEAVKSVMASQGVTVTDVAVTSQSTPVETVASSSAFVFPSLMVAAFSAFMLL